MSLCVPKSTPTKLRQQVRFLQQKVRRQKKVINNLKDLLKNLRRQGILNTECENILLDKFDGTNAEMFKNINAQPKS